MKCCDIIGCEHSHVVLQNHPSISLQQNYVEQNFNKKKITSPQVRKSNIKYQNSSRDCDITTNKRTQYKIIKLTGRTNTIRNIWVLCFENIAKVCCKLLKVLEIGG